jgi:hypothetical protein
VTGVGATTTVAVGPPESGVRFVFGLAGAVVGLWPGVGDARLSEVSPQAVPTSSNTPAVKRPTSPASPDLRRKSFLMGLF